MYFGPSGSCVVVSAPLTDAIPFVRMHSSCLFSESFGAIDCDCSRQLRRSIALIAQEGGYVIYRYDEGRGTGLEHKIASISLQQSLGIDTKEAFEALGKPADPRSYEVEIAAMKYLQIGEKVRLLTNNTAKLDALSSEGFSPFRESLVIDGGKEVQKYFREKVDCLNHLHE